MVQMQPDFTFLFTHNKILIMITRLYINFFINCNDSQFVMELKYILDNDY